MPRFPFDLDAIDALPLWGQALLAARMARRVAQALPAVPAADWLVASSGVIATCCSTGVFGDDEQYLQQRANALRGDARVAAAAGALYYAADSAFAAHDSGDFGAAEAACTNSAKLSIRAAAESRELNATQIQIFAASDLDQLTFACGEFRLGRYDVMTSDVLGRLVPV